MSASDKVSKPRGWSELPESLGAKIFSLLAIPKDIATIARVCRSWNVTASDQSLWQTIYEQYAWQTQLEQDERSAELIVASNWRSLFKHRWTIECTRGKSDTQERFEETEPLIPRTSANTAVSTHSDAATIITDEDDEPLSEVDTGEFVTHFYRGSVPHGGHSPTDQQLSEGDLRLEDVLDLEDFVADMKRGKPVLLEYVLRTSTLKAMVAYITEPPAAIEGGSSHKRYAHLSFEALQLEVVKAYMVRNHEVLDALFAFLERTEHTTDPLRCAYFSKLVEVLSERYSRELVAYFRQKRKAVVDLYVHHLFNQYLSESLYKLVENHVMHAWLLEEDFIPKLLLKLADCDEAIAAGSEAEVEDAWEARGIVATMSTEIIELLVPFSPYSPLCSDALRSPLVAELWAKMTVTGAADAAGRKRLSHGLQVAIALLKLAGVAVDANEDPPLFVATLLDNMPYVAGFLAATNKEVRLTHGNTIPFGALSLRVLEFFATLVKTRYSAVLRAVVERDLLMTFLELFFNYKWNNFIHHHVTSIITTVLDMRDEGVIQNVLLEKCQFVELMLLAFDDTTPVGYKGHLVQLANHLVRTSQLLPAVAAYLATHPNWSTFVERTLGDINTRDRTSIGGLAGSEAASRMSSTVSAEEGEYIEDDDDVDEEEIVAEEDTEEVNNIEGDEYEETGQASAEGVGGEAVLDPEEEEFLKEMERKKKDHRAGLGVGNVAHPHSTEVGPAIDG